MAKEVIQVPSQEELHALFDLVDGRLVWRERPPDMFYTRRAWRIWNARYAHTVAGRVKPEWGLRFIEIHGHSYSARRLTYQYVWGDLTPEMRLTSLDGDPDNLHPDNIVISTYKPGGRPVGTKNKKNKFSRLWRDQHGQEAFG